LLDFIVLRHHDPSDLAPAGTPTRESTRAVTRRLFIENETIDRLDLRHTGSAVDTRSNASSRYRVMLPKEAAWKNRGMLKVT
jgi:hypothetical protein